MTKTSTRSFKPVLYILAASAVVALGYGIFTTYFRPETAQVALITSSGTVSLSLDPSTVTIAPNTETTVAVKVNSGTDRLTTVQLELTYDPTKVTVSNFTPGTYLPVTLASPVIANGKITATLGAPYDGGGKTGSGTIATFKAKPLVAGDHTVSFGAGALAAAASSNTNVLKSVSGITIKATAAGDFNGDNKVDLFDYNKLVGNYGNPYTLQDYNTLVANYGRVY